MRLLSFTLLSSLQVFSPASHAEPFADVDLWLPKSYQKHYIKMIAAAEKAQAEPECYRLLTGRIVESRSSQEQLYFQFRCRTEDRVTFPVQVDGNSLEVVHSFYDRAQILEAKRKAEAEKLAEAEAAAARAAAEARFWKVCKQHIQKRLQAFQGLSVLTEMPPNPSIEGERHTYSVDFDALSPSRTRLMFTANCTISNLEDYKVDVARRRGQ